MSIPYTVLRNKQDYKRFLDGSELEFMNINEITKQDLENVCFENLRRYDLTPKGFLKVRGILKQTLEYAFEESLIVDNPYHRINFKKFQDMLIEPAKIKDRVHSEEELQRILEYTREREEKYPENFASFAMELQILMGLRRGEVTALMWKDVHEDRIDIVREQISINYSTKKAIVNHTKTYTDREFPLTDDIKEFLDRLYRAQEMQNIQMDYLFPQDNELGYLKNDSVYYFYRRMCKNLGIKLSRSAMKGTHSFRRNAITKAVNNSNGNTFLVSKIYGNSPEVINSNYYTSIDMDQARAVVKKVTKG